MGQPVVAYNLFPVKRKTLVEATVYSHDEPATIKAASWEKITTAKISDR